jgi:hypothetical protein
MNDSQLELIGGCLAGWGTNEVSVVSITEKDNINLASAASTPSAMDEYSEAWIPFEVGLHRPKHYLSGTPWLTPYHLGILLPCRFSNPTGDLNERIPVLEVDPKEQPIEYFKSGLGQLQEGLARSSKAICQSAS